MTTLPVTPPPVSTEPRVWTPMPAPQDTSALVWLAMKGLTVNWTWMSVLKVRIMITLPHETGHPLPHAPYNS